MYQLKCLKKEIRHSHGVNLCTILDKNIDYRILFLQMTAFVFTVWLPYKVITLFRSDVSAAVSVSVGWFVFSFVRLFVWCLRPFWSSAPSLWTSVGSTAVCAWPRLEPWSRLMSTRPESSTTSSCLRARSPNLLETDRQTDRGRERERERDHESQ